MSNSIHAIICDRVGVLPHTPSPDGMLVHHRATPGRSAPFATLTLLVERTIALGGFVFDVHSAFAFQRKENLQFKRSPARRELYREQTAGGSSISPDRWMNW